MLTRAPVFCAHQSVHTIAQSRQQTLNYNSIQFWSVDNPVKVSDGSDGHVGVVQQTEEGHSRSCAAVGVVEEVQVSGAGGPAHCSPKLFVKSAEEIELAL
jgi:hypothetical protein